MNGINEAKVRLIIDAMTNGAIMIINEEGTQSFAETSDTDQEVIRVSRKDRDWTNCFTYTKQQLSDAEVAKHTVTIAARMYSLFDYAPHILR
jgi:hypothetical protein